MCRSSVHGFRLLAVALVCVGWVAGCGENYIPVYEKPCENDADCNDGQFCNGTETCDVASAQCQPGTPPDVDDGLDCTFDTCDEFNDTALHLPNDDMCSDGQFCNGVETCDAVAGCVAGAPVEIDDGIACTQDSCDEDSDTVVHGLDDAVCDDGLFCNGTESCSTGGCVAGTPAAVDDGVDCTFDTCDEDLDAAVHLPVDAECDDLDSCTIDTCQPGLGCAAALDPFGDPSCFACDSISYNNGAYDLVNGTRPTDGFINNGIIDDFTFAPGSSEFCELQFSMFRSDITLLSHRQVRVRIYDLGAGGIAALGNFTTTQPFYDETFRVTDSNLFITDTGDDAFGYSAFNYSVVTAPVDLGAGLFGLMLSFPDEGTATGFWVTAPVTGDTDSSYVWGTDVTTPSATTPGFENLAFRFIGQSGAPLPLAPTSQPAEPNTSERVHADSLAARREAPATSVNLREQYRRTLARERRQSRR